MRVAITGPLWTEPLLPYLHPNERSAVPPGLGAPALGDIVRGLLERGVEVLVVTMDRSVGHEVVVTGPRLRLCVGPYRPARRARDGFRAERAFVAAALQKEKPDVVHAHWTYEFALGALASGHSTIVTVHDWAPTVLRYHLHPYRAVRLLMQLETLRRGNYFTAVSPHIQEQVQRWTTRKSAVVPNGLPDAAFNAATRQLNVDEPSLAGVNMGFWRLKNVTTLLRTFALLRRRRPRAMLRLLGTGYEESGSAHKWAQARGLAEGVTFMGLVPNSEVQQVLAQADILVHPSLEESFGMVVLEAMAQGLPTVAGAHSGAVPWLLGWGEAGVLTDVTSPRTFARSIHDLLEDGARWEATSRRAFDRAWKHFRLSDVIEQYVGHYRLAGGMT